MTESPVIRLENITRELRVGQHTVHALRGVSFDVQRGEMLSIIGPSGSGKSTLLGILGGLDSPTGGKLYIDDIDVTRMGEDKLTEIRNEKIGFIFQFFNLIPTLTAQENVALPVQFARKPQFKPDRRARELLELFGLGDRRNHLPTQLSGGQQQRVAIARALANDPPILLADEPTGNLDSDSSATVLNALEEIRQNSNTTIVLVTHDQNLAKRADRILTLVDGEIVDEKPGESTPFTEQAVIQSP